MRLTLLLKDLDLARHYPGHDSHEVHSDAKMPLHEVFLKQRTRTQKNYFITVNLLRV